MKKWGVAVVLLVAGCTKHNDAVCDNGECHDPARPFCDVDGSIDGYPDRCIAVSCTPGEIATCRGEDALTCNAAGDNYDATPCANGCEGAACRACTPGVSQCAGDQLLQCDANAVETHEKCVGGCVGGAEPHCAYLVPRYLPDICATPATGSFTISTSSGAFDTELSTNCTGGRMTQATPPDLCVVRASSIHIEAGATLFATWSTDTGESKGAALALVSDDDLIVDGSIDVGAHMGTDIITSKSGPGGGFSTSGGAPGNTSFGGGGAGGRTAGAAGGTATANGGNNNAGAAGVDPAALQILIGGMRSGGGGGGALTLISCRGSVIINGTINAGGGGGPGGFIFANVLAGGSGGGAGGTIVLQGLNVSITGGVFARGGGGGAGKPSTGDAGQFGGDGVSHSPPLGGIATAGAGDGGEGGGLASPTVGKRSTVAGASSGGGGGAAGFIQTVTPMGIDPVVTGSTSVPPLGTPLHVPTR